MSTRPAGPSRPRGVSAGEISDSEGKAYLVDRVITLLDRTFVTEGRGEGLRMVREMLLRLDRDSLRDLLHEFGIEAPEELEQPAREDRT